MLPLSKQLQSAYNTNYGSLQPIREVKRLDTNYKSHRKDRLDQNTRETKRASLFNETDIMNSPKITVKTKSKKTQAQTQFLKTSLENNSLLLTSVNESVTSSVDNKILKMHKVNQKRTITTSGFQQSQTYSSFNPQKFNQK